MGYDERTYIMSLTLFIYFFLYQLPLLPHFSSIIENVIVQFNSISFFSSIFFSFSLFYYLSNDHINLITKKFIFIFCSFSLSRSSHQANLTQLHFEWETKEEKRREKNVYLFISWICHQLLFTFESIHSSHCLIEKVFENV